MASSERDPRHHIQKMRKALKEIQDHMRDDITKIDEPQLKAMSERILASATKSAAELSSFAH